jgi:tRNA(fMet)-specific endonuclease VapC
VPSIKIFLPNGPWCARPDFTAAAAPGRRPGRALAAIMSAVDVLDYTQATAAHHGRPLAHVRRAGTPRGAHAAQTGRTIMSRDAQARFGDLPA